MIEINNITFFAVDKKFLTGVAKKVLKGENRVRERISLAFVSEEEIKKLNKKYRGKNKPTDVLSFSLNEKEYLGEIIICPEVVKENSEKYEVDFKKEIARIFIHGILHLCGYDHEKNGKQAKIMEEREERYLNNFKF